MVEVPLIGKTVLSTRANGPLTQLLVTVNSRMWRETSTKVTGKTTRPMGTVRIRQVRVPSMRVGGCRTSNTEKELRPGKKVRHTKETTSLVRKKAKASTLGQMDPLMKETG